jgi:ADP-heptose:LPS heptosyltransferase
MSKKFKMALGDRLIGTWHRLTGYPQTSLSASEDFSSIAIWSTTALGDLMFNTPAIHQLRQRFPNATLTLIVHQKYTELVKNYPEIDEVLSWDGRFAGIIRFVRQLRRLKPQLAVILHSRAPYDVLSAVWSGCRVIIRDDAYADNVPLARWLAAASQRNFSGHVIQRKLDLLSVLGCRTDQSDMHVPCTIDRSRYTEANKVRIGFQLGASSPERCWPTSYFADLANRLLADHPERQIVLMGIQSESPLAQAFSEKLDPQFAQQVVSMIGKTTVRDAFDLVAGLDLLVTGDTGPLHLAIALRVPTASLFVTAEPEFTGPYQDPHLHRVIRPAPGTTERQDEQNPMNSIQPSDVEEPVLALLGTGMRNTTN